MKQLVSILARGLSIVVFACALSWCGLWEYIRLNAPETANENLGYVYPINFHGHELFISSTEQLLLYALPIIGGAVFIYQMTRALRDHGR